MSGKSKMERLEDLTAEAEAAGASAAKALRAQLEGASRGEFVPGYREALAESGKAQRAARDLLDEVRRES